MCHLIFTSATFEFTFSTRKRYEPEYVLTPETKIHEQDWSWVCKKVAPFVPRNQCLKLPVLTIIIVQGLDGVKGTGEWPSMLYANVCVFMW